MALRLRPNPTPRHHEFLGLANEIGRGRQLCKNVGEVFVGRHGILITTVCDVDIMRWGFKSVGGRQPIA